MWIDKTVEGLASNISLDRDSEITITTLGPSSHTGMVQKILAPFFSAIHISARTGSHEGSETVNSRGRSSDIAVIGMSGRFPFAEDVKEFWEVLQAGHALHEMVIFSYKHAILIKTNAYLTDSSLSLLHFRLS